MYVYYICKSIIQCCEKVFASSCFFIRSHCNITQRCTQNAVCKCLFHLLGEKAVQTYLALREKMNCPLLLNHERTVINHIILEIWVIFHYTHPGLITARPFESRHHLNRTCLRKWSMLKEQHIMPWSKEIQEQMRNKIVEMYQSGKGYKATSKASGLQRTKVRAVLQKWRKLGTVVINVINKFGQK